MARRHRQLDATVTALQQRYGPQALRRGTAQPQREVPLAVATGFAQLDALTGCGGIPLGHMTLLSGRATSGKLTLAYTLLAQAQAAAHTVALLDLTHSADPDYLSRCGVDLMRLVVVRPRLDTRLLNLLLDLARSRQLRLLVVDSLHELTQTRALRRAWPAVVRRLPPLLRAAGCGVVLLAEPCPPWQRWLGVDAPAPVRGQAALYLEVQRERWLYTAGQLCGYAVCAQVVHSRWAASGRSATVEFVFNGTVQARQTW